MSSAVHTEATMLALLAERYSQVYGGADRWAFATQVRSTTGFEAARVADAVAMDLWPANGLELHGFEVKVSRADWLTELREPDKATVVGQFCHRWWLVVPDRDVVRGEELPADWGLLVIGGNGKLRAAKAAPKRQARQMPRSFVAALLRAAVKTERARW